MIGFVSEGRTKSQWGQWRRAKSALVLRWRMRSCTLQAAQVLETSLLLRCLHPLRHQRWDRPTGVWSDGSPHHVSDHVFHASDSEHHDQGDHADVPRYRWDGRDTLQAGKRTGAHITRHSGKNKGSNDTAERTRLALSCGVLKAYVKCCLKDYVFSFSFFSLDVHLRIQSSLKGFSDKAHIEEKEDN